MNRVAYCGINCDACRLRVAVLENDVRHLPLDMAEGMDLNTSTACEGCRENNGCGACSIMDCLFERNSKRIKPLLHCGECECFPCALIIKFESDGVYHHKEAIENLYRIREIGMDAFLIEQDIKWKCPTCGKRLSWYLRTCPDCK